MAHWPWQLFRMEAPTPENTQYVPSVAVPKAYEPVDRPTTPEWWEFVGELQRWFQYDPDTPKFGRMVEIAALAENFINKLAQRKEQEIAAMLVEREETVVPEQRGHFPAPPDYFIHGSVGERL